MEIIKKIITTAKHISDNAIKPIKYIEEISSDESASYLEGMERSLQLDGYSCGVQATFSILKYYGKARSVQNVDKLLNAYNMGYASESAIYKLLRKRKLKVSRRLNANISTIKGSIDVYEAPMLTTIDGYEHWIVVYGYSKKKYFCS